MNVLYSNGASDHRDLHSFPTRRSSDLNSAPILAPNLRPDRLREKSASVCDWGADTCANGRGFLSKAIRSEEHTSELQSQSNLVCRLLLEKKNYIEKQFDAIVKRIANYV